MLIGLALPSEPVRFEPQHLCELSGRIAQVRSNPPEISIGQVLVGKDRVKSASPISLAASPRLLTSPRPNCPKLLRPRHLMEFVIKNGAVEQLSCGDGNSCSPCAEVHRGKVISHRCSGRASVYRCSDSKRSLRIRSLTFNLSCGGARANMSGTCNHVYWSKSSAQILWR